MRGRALDMGSAPLETSSGSAPGLCQLKFFLDRKIVFISIVGHVVSPQSYPA